MTEHYVGALLYLVPVLVAAIVAFVVTRPEKDESSTVEVRVERRGAPRGPAPRDGTRRDPAPSGSTRVEPGQHDSGLYDWAQHDWAPRGSTPRDPGPRLYSPSRRLPAPTPPPHPTLLHAALSTHLTAVSATARSKTPSLSAQQAARLVSIRRPARIPRRPAHRCPRKA